VKKNLLLIFGGGSSEHDVSIISADFLRSQINHNIFNIIDIEINKNFEWIHKGEKLVFDTNGNITLSDKTIIKVDSVVPCIHGYPGETGDLQSLLEMTNIPYFGNTSESSKICFNKIITKLWLDKVGIETTPFLALTDSSKESLEKVDSFFDEYGSLFVKASNQGSSVGCYPLHDKKLIKEILEKAFELSDYVLVEQELKGRELEVSVFDYQGKVHATAPGEIICPSKFYSFDEKYKESSDTKTYVEAKDLSEIQISTIKKMAISAFKTLKLKDLARIDFFLTDSGFILINEINTFPGMTPISMFPKMMENYGIKFSDYIAERLTQL
jgi:D-alanine-D-alanine ligase